MSINIHGKKMTLNVKALDTLNYIYLNSVYYNVN